MSYAPESQQGLRFMASMGLGVILVSPPVTALCLYLYGGGIPSTDKVKVSARFGTVSGNIWGLGNAASIIAVQSGAGLAVAYPVMQAGRGLEHHKFQVQSLCSTGLSRNVPLRNSVVQASPHNILISLGLNLGMAFLTLS